ncbi:DUF4097 family beta strand repeat-containing protein [Amycolatopsis sp. CA-230715]|uniref:DUF4097 family beta strand repeat-containing protein n=1 Tax=Amycolatopsis sp. CA-230715 TaxID=2745196 RepID=UPI001C014754|nr:DUF4097 family beta strand repeat-containing protein [Amycolatopsis sp. CA-230715]QWF80723.1 hypothetical protein HUW46_04147 [Amycolatopsis sp. CA-230715]
MGKTEVRVLGAVVLGAAVALTITACNGLGPAEAASDGKPITAPVSVVKFDIPTGGVKVHVEDGAPVSIRRELKFTGSKPVGDSHHVDGGALVLNGCGEGCSVDYDVVLPAALPVSGFVGIGSIDLDRAASADVRTTTGGIDVRGVSGAVRAEAQTGDVRTAQTKPGTVYAAAQTGAVTVTVPPSAYRVTADAQTGPVDLRVPNTPSAPNTVEARTGTGPVTVRPS